MGTSAILKTNNEIVNLTTIEKEALTNVSIGKLVFDTTLNRLDQYLDIWGWHPVGSITPDWGYDFVDENVNSSTNSFFSLAGINGGIASSTTNAILSPTVLWGISTGPNTNGEYRHSTSGAYLLGSTGKKYFKNAVSMSALSDVSNRFITLVGYFRTLNGIVATDGMYFLYDEGGVFDTATASSNWLCVCRSGGSYTIVDSGIAVVTTASGLQKMEIFDHGTGAKVDFFINDSLAASIDTNIPDNTTTIAAGERIVKTTGTTPCTLFVDYTHIKEKFNNPR